jgi:hypothetical protein
MQAISILRCVVIINEGSSRLTILKFPSFSFSDMFLAIGGGFGT